MMLCHKPQWLKAATIDSHRGAGLWGSALLDSMAHSLLCCQEAGGWLIQTGWAVLQLQVWMQVCHPLRQEAVLRMQREASRNT